MSTPLPGKKGVCFLLRNENDPKGGTWVENLPKVQELNGYWIYTWGFDGYDIIQQKTEQTPPLQWIPMSWGAWGVDNFKESIVRSKVPQLIENGSIGPMFLGFNEPDQTDQSNMSVENALLYWDVLETTLPIQTKFVSPGCAHPNGPWMTQFMVAAKEQQKRIDYIAVHWYGSPNFSGFCTNMKQYYEKYQLPILITEFACADWNAKTTTTTTTISSNNDNNNNNNRYQPTQVLAFMKQVIPWLEQTEWIIGYTWFSFDETSPQGFISALFHTDGTLTKLGQYYKSIRTENPMGDVTIS